MVTLKDGSESADPRLDRLVEFDERSRNYALVDEIGRKKPRSYTWRIQSDYLINQGREGACVGYAIANELQARPSEVDLGPLADAELFATRRLYWEAQKIDPWDGGAYPGASPQYAGTSVLAGVKVAQSLGYFGSYRWTFTLEDLVNGLGRHGPAVMGLAWFDSCYAPNKDGFIRPMGNLVGGHAILARAVKIEWKEDSAEETFDDVHLDRSFITLRNSWGRWGHKGSGDCFVTLRDMGTWLTRRAEAVFFDDRTTDPS